MQYLSVALPLAAMVSGAFASPQWGNDPSCASNACLAAVTGSAALGDGSIRASHCSSYLATTVTPIVTVTATVTGSGNDNWKRATVALCPNEVPNYASACDDADYTSACSCFGFTEIKTTTIAPSTTTKTVYVAPTGVAGSCTASTVSVTATSVVVKGSTCPAASTSTTTSTKVVVTGTTSTATVTVTKGGYSSGSVSTVTVATATTVTVTKGCSSSSYSAPATSTCNVTPALATTLVTNFINLLEHTSYNGTQAPPGSGYNYAVSAATLATDFVDISDSINFMAGFPLGSVTFASKAAFDYGQGILQPEVTVDTLNIWAECNTITWRWRIVSLPYPVNGINQFEVNSAGLIQKNYAEFDNGAWLQSFGQKCAINPVSVATTVALKV